MKDNSTTKIPLGFLVMDGDVWNNKNLTPVERLVLSYCRVICNKTGQLSAFNKTIANDCGLSLKTTARTIQSLTKKGWMQGQKGNGSKITVRMSEPWHKDRCGIPDAKNGAFSGQTGTGEGQFGCCIREGRLENAYKYEDDEKGVSSSILKNSTPSAKSQTKKIALDWSRQAVTRMNPYRHTDKSTEKTSEIPVPKPIGINDQEAEELLNVASALYPDKDPCMASRAALRICLSDSKTIDTVQYYANLRHGALSAVAVIRISKRIGAGQFIQECAAAHDISIPEPVDIIDGDDDRGRRIFELATRNDNRYSGELWNECWTEAGARCRCFNISPEMYAAMVFARCTITRNTIPPPWVADSLTADQIEKAKKEYKKERWNAWTGGPESNGGNPNMIPPNFTPNPARIITQALVRGHAEFPSKSCMECAASELEMMPELVRTIKGWNGTAEELAEKLRVAATTCENNLVPISDSCCGRHCYEPPMRLCPRGLTEVGGDYGFYKLLVKYALECYPDDEMFLWNAG